MNSRNEQCRSVSQRWIISSAEFELLGLGPYREQRELILSDTALAMVILRVSRERHAVGTLTTLCSGSSSGISVRPACRPGGKRSTMRSAAQKLATRINICLTTLRRSNRVNFRPLTSP
jgi:hypothetical protein